MANDDAAREAGGDAPVTAEHLVRAAADYFPSRDEELLVYMELLAVFESSSRRLLPAKYAVDDARGTGHPPARAPGRGGESAAGLQEVRK